MFRNLEGLVFLTLADLASFLFYAPQHGLVHALIRMAIVFRDPRDVIISEHRMRIGVFHEANTSDIAPFIFERFEVNVGIRISV